MLATPAVILTAAVTLLAILITIAFAIMVSRVRREFHIPPPTVTGPDLVVNRDFAFEHVYSKPGTYTIHVGALSDDPRSSNADATLRITVHA